MQDWRNKYSKKSPEIGLDELMGCTYCKTVFKACIPDEQLDTIFSVKTSYNFLLCGGAGNGKRTLASAFAKEMIDCGYSYARIKADYLIGTNDDETCENITSFFDTIIDEAQTKGAKGCFVFLEDISNLVLSKPACATLNYRLELINGDEAISTIVVATAEDVLELPSVLKSTMFVCMANLPDKEDREDYLKSRLDANIYIERSIQYKQMAEITEGFNYGMLNKLVMVVFMLAKQYMVANAKEDGVTVSEYLNVSSFTLTKNIFLEIVDNMKISDNTVAVSGSDAPASISAPQPTAPMPNVAPAVAPVIPVIPQPSFAEPVGKEKPAIKKENPAAIDEPQGDIMAKFKFLMDNKSSF
ncbi:MAG: AAA family ATPase [Acutalibacteraceae bacterium]|nr:AAA family ATPase [Acutalibacteraceae bacterium]